MAQYAMLIDYGHCTGCDSCEVSCCKEKGLPLEEWGIKVQQIGPKKLGDKWEWDYVPVPSRLCDLCADRLEDGKVPLCQLHCLAKVIEVIPVEDVPARMVELGGKVTCFMP
ncbi:MAG: hypothetical protein ACOYIP_02920 [Coriobacteriales bacterium]|jgi:Fe-S-cluster-containing dehydrogenase component